MISHPDLEKLSSESEDCGNEVQLKLTLIDFNVAKRFRAVSSANELNNSSEYSPLMFANTGN